MSPTLLEFLNFLLLDRSGICNSRIKGILFTWYVVCTYSVWSGLSTVFTHKSESKRHSARTLPSKFPNFTELANLLSSQHYFTFSLACFLFYRRQPCYNHKCITCIYIQTNLESKCMYSYLS